ncbi:MAG: hypothetical protein ACI9UN_001016 [Granulosicoccus sp.]|jgi:hypothetical protein
MSNLNRRKFLSFLSVSTTIPTLAIFSQSTAFATDFPMVDEMSVQAVALKYLSLSETDSHSCSTCALFQGDADAKIGTCPLFNGSRVSANAVCVAWAPKG